MECSAALLNLLCCTKCLSALIKEGDTGAASESPGCHLRNPVVQRLLSGASVEGLVFQKLADQVPGIIRHVCPGGIFESIVALFHSLCNLGIILSRKRGVEGKKNVHDHTATPDVSGLIIISSEYLR